MNCIAVIGYCCLLLCFPLINAKVVVFFPAPHASYVRTHTYVARALAQMGHNTYVCVPQFLLTDKMVEEEGYTVIPYGDYLGNVEEIVGKPILEKVWRGQAFFFSSIPSVTKLIQKEIRQILLDKVLRRKLEYLHPDLIVITSLPPVRNMVILPYIVNAPFAFMSPLYDVAIQRVPFSPSATVCPLFAGFGEYKPGFLERFRNSLCHLALFIAPYLNDQILLADVAPHKPQISVDEISHQAEIFIIESDHILDFAKPELPNIKVVGSTSSRPAKPLKEPFLSFLNKSKSGVAVVTFGSAVLEVPEEISAKMISAFQNQSLDVVWRVDIPSPNPSKILTSKWIPQNDILGHPKTKLFVSHCGANGQYEALYHGVPMLCLPLFGDQHYNARRSTVKGFGLTGDIVQLTAEEFNALIKEMTNNITYTQNIQRASMLYRELFKTPLKEAAFWLDHVMDFGGSYMRSSGQEMPLYQFWVLDVLLVFGLAFVLFVILIFCICRCCFNGCRRIFFSRPQNTKKKAD